MSYASGRCCSPHCGSFRCQALVLIAMVALIMSACSGGPPPRLYLLEPAQSVAADNTVSDVAVGALGFTQVVLPGYASDVRIASRAGDGLIVQLDRERWAEEPEDAISRLFSQRLRQYSDSPVLIEPWPRDYEPVARIELVFDQILRQSDGGAHASGHIQVLSGDGRRLVQTLPFDERVAGNSQDGSEFFKAMAVVIDGLATETIQSLVATDSAS